MSKKGSLVNVGLGMTLGAHITPISRNFIEKADVVFVAASNNIVEEWVMTMNKDVRSLQEYYHDDVPRKQTYKKWIELMMEEVRTNKNVVGAFYGHPGVFAWAPHESIIQARKEGFLAHMEPGISAEDCLYADLGINPGFAGCIHYQAYQFLYHNKKIDTSSYLILWQASIAGNKSSSRYQSQADDIKNLTNKLLENYPSKHEIILYECSVLPTDEIRNETIKLEDLIKTQIHMKTTIAIPPI